MNEGETSRPFDGEHYTPLGWHPLAFFHDLVEGGPLILGCVVASFIACAGFLYLAVRRQHFFSYFALPLFLALVPFALHSVITFLRVYSMLYMLPSAGLVDLDFTRMLRRAGYTFQFGILLSGALLFLHAVIYASSRGNRSA